MKANFCRHELLFEIDLQIIHINGNVMNFQQVELSNCIETFFLKDA